MVPICLTVLSLYFQAAYVENLNGPYLFESMYAEDAEGQKLNHMPGVPDMLIGYPFQFDFII